ncbi:MAG: MFS transporter [Gammaproteobacteria bacterium]|nr:MFS transporter [Gammaproteobacteria bacterium]
MKRQLLFVYCSRMLASCVYFGFLPFLVYYVAEFHNYDYGHGVVVLIVVSIFSDIVKYTAGRFLCQYPARKIILITLIILSVVMWLFQFATILPIYFTLIIGIIVGACFGVFYVFFRILFSDLSSQGSAVRYHSYMASANNIGLVAGPLLFAAFLGIEMLDNIFQVFCILGLISYFFMSLVKETDSGPTTTAIDLTIRKPMIGIFIANAIYWAILQQVILNLVIYYQDYFSNVKFGAFFFSIQAITTAIALPAISKYFESKKPEALIHIFILGGLIMSFGYFAAGFSDNIWVFSLCLLIMMTLGQSFSIPTINTVITKTAVSKQELGNLFGLLGVTQGIGIAVGHLIGGIIYFQMMKTIGENWYWTLMGSIGLIFFFTFLVARQRATGKAGV